MAVTIQTIETKEFKTKAHGYDPEEVDVFLDEIADEFEEMQREIQSLRSATAQQQSAPPPPPPKQVIPEPSETIQKMLASAQRVSDETMADARKQAEIVLAEAKDRAESLIADAKREATRLQDSLDTLRGAANDYRARFKRLLDDQMHLVNGEPELFK
jgi:DivIVA domain